MAWISLYAVESMAQGIPPKGTDNTLDVATWNIEWFGGAFGPSNDELQFRNVLSVIRAADIDLWGLQEVSNAGYFDRLLDSLGTGYDAYQATYGQQQKLAFVYKTDVIHVNEVGHILEAFEDDFAGRPPLELVATTSTVPERTVTFITVHMKAEDGNPASFEKRQAAGGRIKNHIDFTGLANEMVIVLGDFNDTLTGSISSSSNTSPYANFVADQSNFQFLTEDLERDGRSTYCGNSCNSGSVIDHILITNELFNRYIGSSVDHFDELLTEVGNYLNTTSDHLPVFASFQLNTQTDIERDAFDSNSLSVYPNPATESFRVEVVGLDHGLAGVNVFDVTGRLVYATTTSKTGRSTSVSESIEIRTADWARGLYVIELLTNEAPIHRTVVLN